MQPAKQTERSLLGKRPTSLNEGPGDNPDNRTFRTTTLKEAIATGHDLPPLKELYPELLNENECNILFGDTGIGKTAYVTQMCDYMARRGSTVLMFDCELSKRNVANRYNPASSPGEHYTPPDNFYRAELNPDCLDFDDSLDYNDRIMQDLEHELQKINADVIIVDNITYLRDDTERAKDASPLMKLLKKLQRKHNLTILVLAHTPKRDNSRKLSRNDLQGSSRLSQFVDQLIAIGGSRKDDGIRYIKQLKTRNSELVYNDENIMLLEITDEGGWLHFKEAGYGVEEEHLTDPTASEKSDRDEMILSYSRTRPEMSVRAIALACGCSKDIAFRTLKKYKQAQEGGRK